MHTTLRPGTLDERPEPVKAPRVETRGANDNAPSKPNGSNSLVALSRELARGQGWERDPRASAKDASASALGWVERYIYEIVRAAVREELSLAVSSPSAKSAAPSEYLTITRAAEIADVHACTIREWIKNGSLKSYLRVLSDHDQPFWRIATSRSESSRPGFLARRDQERSGTG